MFPRPRATSLLALGLLIAALALSACRPKITAPSEPPLAVRLGDDAFRLQDYEAAIEDYGVYIDSVERGEYTPLAFYQTALCWYRLERYEQSLDVLAELDRRYQGEHWVQVDALRGDALYKLDRRSAALIAWDEGWRVAEPEERPELRRRIVAVLREMDEDELIETRNVVRDPDVLALVEHHLAIKQGRPVPPFSPPPAERETHVAAAEPAPKQPSSSAAVLEANEPAPTPSGPGAGAVVERADKVSDDADEVARLSDELDDTGGEVFEAIEETEEAEGQIRDVDESTASYAPLLKVEIPEPPIVDREVPEPKKRLMVAPPSEPQANAVREPQVAAASEPQVAAAGEPIAEETVGTKEVQVASGPPVALEPVDAAAAAASEDNAAASAPVSGAKVACILPLTGGDRVAGERLLRSIRLVFGAGSDEIVFRDSGSDPAVARQLVADLTAESDVLIAIAPAGARDARSIAGSADRAAVPLLLVSSTAVPKTRYVLSVPAEGGASAESFASEYRERYGSAPGAMDSQVHRAALLAKQALLIAPVSRSEVLSRIAAPPPAASDSAS